MGGQEETAVARQPRPCGEDRVRVVMAYGETARGSCGHDWRGAFERGRRAPHHAFVGAGRGVHVVRVEETEHCDRLRQDARTLASRFLPSDEVDAAFERLARDLDALPEPAARYRPAVRPGLGTGTLPTFLKHTRDGDTRRWLAPARHMPRVDAFFAHIGADRGRGTEVVARTAALRGRASHAISVSIPSLGPIPMTAGPAGGFR